LLVGASSHRKHKQAHQAKQNQAQKRQPFHHKQPPLTTKRTRRPRVPDRKLVEPEHVHDADLREAARKEVGPLVDARGHEQAACCGLFGWLVLKCV
jgi:hypothetical protein